MAMGNTIDEELLLDMIQELRQYQDEDHTLETVWSDMHTYIRDWLVAAQLDPETFDSPTCEHLIRKAAQALDMTLN